MDEIRKKFEAWVLLDKSYKRGVGKYPEHSALAGRYRDWVVERLWEAYQQGVKDASIGG